jgi:hypothetical protein
VKISNTPRTGPNAVNPRVGSNRRSNGGSRTRFAGTGHHGDKAAASLRADHPALLEARPLFTSRIMRADDARVPRLLVGGENNGKIGRTIEKGAWAGMPVFTLTLAERITCPKTCEVWAQCYGNAMHLPRRILPGQELIDRLRRELGALQAAHPRGFAVRPHILGDFYDVEYVRAWRFFLDGFPALRVWGYTARLPGTPIGDAIVTLAALHPARFRMRFSVANDAPAAPMTVTSIWRDPAAIKTMQQPEGKVCPQQFDKTATCGTCGLCWSAGNEASRIVFVGHGMRQSHG